MLPNYFIRSRLQSNITDVQAIQPFLLKITRQGDWQLIIDQKFHFDSRVKFYLAVPPRIEGMPEYLLLVKMDNPPVFRRG